MEEFLTDPTQRANALLELFEAVEADGIVCALADDAERRSLAAAGYDLARMVAQERVAASLEAARRLRATVGDRAVLVAGLTGPATLAGQSGAAKPEDLAKAGQAIAGLARKFCEAGAGIILVFEQAAPLDLQAWRACLQTLSNIVRFFQGLSFIVGCDGPLPRPALVPLGSVQPRPSGVVITPGEVPPTTSIEELRLWVRSLR